MKPYTREKKERIDDWFRCKQVEAGKPTGLFCHPQRQEDFMSQEKQPWERLVVFSGRITAQLDLGLRPVLVPCTQESFPIKPVSHRQWVSFPVAVLQNSQSGRP